MSPTFPYALATPLTPEALLRVSTLHLALYLAVKLYSWPSSFLSSGHVLVSPLRVVPRLRDLDDGELCDLFRTVQRVSTLVEGHVGATRCKPPLGTAYLRGSVFLCPRPAMGLRD